MQIFEQGIVKKMIFNGVFLKNRHKKIRGARGRTSRIVGGRCYRPVRNKRLTS